VSRSPPIAGCSPPRTPGRMRPPGRRQPLTPATAWFTFPAHRHPCASPWTTLATS
jgi:hypothetical protein